jgi:methyl-accepting chemotaxis protein
VAINEINNAVAQLDTVTQQNSSLVEEIASSSENMSSLAGDMNNLIVLNFVGKGK